jgi:hypothetical protein
MYILKSSEGWSVEIAFASDLHAISFLDVLATLIEKASDNTCLIKKVHLVSDNQPRLLIHPGGSKFPQIIVSIDLPNQ